MFSRVVLLIHIWMFVQWIQACSRYSVLPTNHVILIAQYGLIGEDKPSSFPVIFLHGSLVHVATEWVIDAWVERLWVQYYRNVLLTSKWIEVSIQCESVYSMHTIVNKALSPLVSCSNSILISSLACCCTPSIGRWSTQSTPGGDRCTCRLVIDKGFLELSVMATDVDCSLVEYDCFCGLRNQDGKACSNEGSLRTDMMDSSLMCIIIFLAFLMAVSDELTICYRIIKYRCMFACLVQSKVLFVSFSPSLQFLSSRKKKLCEIKGLSLTFIQISLSFPDLYTMGCNNNARYTHQKACDLTLRWICTVSVYPEWQCKMHSSL